MKDLTVIIPILELDAPKQELFKKAVKSVGEDTAILVVGSKAALDTVASEEGFETLVNKSKDTTYANQVNLAVKSVKTKYFSVLEYDDTFSPIWLENVEKYIADDTDGIFAFLPLTEVVGQEGHIIGYANEAVWASSFSDEIGYFDITSLEEYLNFNMSGAVLKTEDFLTLGGLKPSMKIVFWYEFLLRALYKTKKVFVIPKVGYYHNVGRADSMTSVYADTISSKEADWWIDLAKKEYFFPQDRKKAYEE